MRKELLLTISNFRKNKGSSIGLFILCVVSAALILISLMLLWDVYPTARTEAQRLNATGGMALLDGDLSGIDEETLFDMWQEDVKTLETYHALYPGTVEMPFADNMLEKCLVIHNSDAFHTEMNRTGIVCSDETVTEDYIYLPYQFYASGGCKTGDTYSFELRGETYSYTVKGFHNNTYMGCSNYFGMLFIIDDVNYARMFDALKADSEAVVVNYELKETIRPASFKLRAMNSVQARNSKTEIEVLLYEDAIYAKGVMALLFAVVFLAIAFVVFAVVVLILGNCISNYIRENLKSIGVWKAIGYTASNIRTSLFLLFGSIAVFGGVIGIGVGYLLMPVMARLVVGQMGVPYTVSFDGPATLAAMSFEVLLVLLVTAAVSRKLKSIDPIVALRDGMAAHNFKKDHVRLEQSALPLHASLAMKTMLANKKQNVITFIASVLLIFICVLGLLLYENFHVNFPISFMLLENYGGEVYVDNESREEVRAYLESRTDITHVRINKGLYLNCGDEDALWAFMLGDVTGMNNQTACYKGRLPQYDNEIAISGKFASDYGYKIGDEITFQNGNRSFAYLITGFVQTTSNLGKEAVLSDAAAKHLYDIDNMDMGYLFDCDDQERVQTVLDDCKERFGGHILSVTNFYELIGGVMSVFQFSALLILVVICVIAVIVVTLILSLLIRSLIYNKRKDYGIYKALGYTSGSLILQTALSFMPSVILAVTIGSVAAYYATNPYLSFVLQSFGLMRCAFPIPIGGVVMIGIGMVLVSFAIAVLQSCKIRKIEAYRMLVGE